MVVGAPDPVPARRFWTSTETMWRLLLAGATVGVITNTGPATATLSVNVPAASGSTYAGTITDGYNQLGLSLGGQGEEVLAGSNSYSGGTTVQNGVLQLGSPAALGTGQLAANGGTLDLAGYSVTVPSFSGAAGVVVNSSSATLAMLTTTQFGTTSFGGSITDGAGASV